MRSGRLLRRDLPTRRGVIASPFFRLNAHGLAAMPYANTSYAHCFPDMPDDARLWIYAAERPMTPDEQRALARDLSGFAEGWISHGRPVRGAVEIIEDRFLLIAATITGGDVSGCGIDASVRAIEDAGRRLSLAWLPALQVFYRAEDATVQSCPRSAFRERIAAGAITTDTAVFDPSTATVGALRSGAFEKPAGQSWHARAFQIPEPA